jgi:hypothetical protein
VRLEKPYKGRSDCAESGQADPQLLRHQSHPNQSDAHDSGSYWPVRRLVPVLHGFSVRFKEAKRRFAAHAHICHDATVSGRRRGSLR